MVLLYEDNFNFLSKMCLAAVRAACCEMVGAARRRGARVIVAGSDVTDAPEPYLRAGADVALLGEGLAALAALLGGSTRTSVPSRSCRANSPAWPLCDGERLGA